MRRYQECGRIEKAYRWLRHMPLAYLSFCWWLVKWPFTGFAFDERYERTRRDWAAKMLRMSLARAGGRMRDYLTDEEMRQLFEGKYSG